jgi:hypothetical protein
LFHNSIVLWVPRNEQGVAAKLPLPVLQTFGLGVCGRLAFGLLLQIYIKARVKKISLYLIFKDIKI